MVTLSSSGKKSSSKSSPWRKLETGEVAWDNLDRRSQEDVVRHYAPKIKIIGLRLKAKLPKNIELSELISAGSLGLVEALRKFDPTMGIKFDTYAENRIKGAMLDELRKLDWYSRGQRQRLRAIEEATRRLEGEFGRTPTIEELAKATDLSEKDVEHGLELIQNQVILSLDNMTDGMVKTTSQDEDPFHQAAFHELVDKISGLIDDLTPREKLVLSLYYGEELNMRETAEVMDITEGRVSQLHSQALAKLRVKIREQFEIERL